MNARRLVAALAAATLLVPTIAACGDNPKETKCSDYLKKSPEDKKQLIKDVAKAEKTSFEGDEEEMVILGFDMLCKGNEDKTLQEVGESAK